MKSNEEKTKQREREKEKEIKDQNEYIQDINAMRSLDMLQRTKAYSLYRYCLHQARLTEAFKFLDMFFVRSHRCCISFSSFPLCLLCSCLVHSDHPSL